MPFYHRVYTPGQLQFITARTYRRTPVFLSDRFRHGFVQRREEVPNTNSMKNWTTCTTTR
jgi:hypothetical protein